MKKIIILIIFALLCLSGCGTKGYSKISNGDDIIFTGPDKNFTREDLYKTLKLASESSIENDIINKIANSMDLDQEAIDKEVETEISFYVSMGYSESDLEPYKGQLRTSIVFEKLEESYVDDNFDDFIKKDKPVKMQIASFDNNDTAENFRTLVNAGSDFETAATNSGYTGDCTASVYLDSDTTLPLEVKSNLNSTSSTGLSSTIVVSNKSTDSEGNETTTDTYYVLNIISRNAEDFKDEYKTAKINAVGEDGIKEYLFSKHNIKFYDQDIYEMMKATYEVFE